MIELTLNNKVYFLPETWNELTPAQLAAYARFVFGKRRQVFERKEGKLAIAPGQEETYRHMQFAMLYFMMDLPYDEFALIDNEAVRYLIDDEKVLDFLFTSYDLDVNLFSVLKPGRELLYGPTELSQLSFEEFSIADKHYLNFVQTGDVEDLNEFVACLYRRQAKAYNPEDAMYTGDRREPFNQFTIHYRRKLMPLINEAEKIGALIWYECARELMVINHEVVFKESDEGTEQPSLADMMLAIGNGLNGFDLVRTSSVMLVMADLKRNILEAKRLKRQSKQ